MNIGQCPDLDRSPLYFRGPNIKELHRNIEDKTNRAKAYCMC